MILGLNNSAEVAIAANIAWATFFTVAVIAITTGILVWKWLDERK